MMYITGSKSLGVRKCTPKCVSRVRLRLPDVLILPRLHFSHLCGLSTVRGLCAGPLSSFPGWWLLLTCCLGHSFWFFQGQPSLCQHLLLLLPVALATNCTVFSLPILPSLSCPGLPRVPFLSLLQSSESGGWYLGVSPGIPGAPCFSSAVLPDVTVARLSLSPLTSCTVLMFSSS